MRRQRPNPPWLTEAIADSYAELEDKVPPQWLPRLEDVRATAEGHMLADVKEYGCGAYGCVIPTLEADVVLKATTDESEADFAAKHAGSLVADVVVKYYMVVQLSAHHEGHRVFLLWREAAEKIGDLSGKAEKLVDTQFELAKQAFSAIRDKRSDKTIRVALAAWLMCLDKAASDKTVGALFAGLARIARQQRIFISDVHAGNLGMVRGQWRVSDPGNVAELRADWLEAR